MTNPNSNIMTLSTVEMVVNLVVSVERRLVRRQHAWGGATHQTVTLGIET